MDKTEFMNKFVELWDQVRIAEQEATAEAIYEWLMKDFPIPESDTIDNRISMIREALDDIEEIVNGHT